jgi:hypothetical protein
MQYECRLYWLWKDLLVSFCGYTRVVKRDGSRQAAIVWGRPLGGRHAAKHAMSAA